MTGQRLIPSMFLLPFCYLRACSRAMKARHHGIHCENVIRCHDEAEGLVLEANDTVKPAGKDKTAAISKANGMIEGLGSD